MKRSLIALATAAIAALAFSGCTDSDAPAAGGSESPVAGDLQAVKVAALPITETSAIWAGIEAGFFEEQGLDVEVLPAQGGAQAIPAMLSGDVQFAIGQPFGPFRADLQDLGVAIIGNFASSHEEGPDVNAVVASAASGITRLADLAGKRVSVNSLGAAGDVTIMAAVEADGGDPSTIEFVEVAFPDAPGQLAAGNIDAAWVPEPFVTQLVGGGDTLVVYPYQDVLPGLATLTVITTSQLMDEDPELVEAFSTAMRETLDWANDPANEDAVRQAIKDNLELPEAVADSVPFPVYSFDLDRDTLEELAELAVEYGVLPSAPDFDRLIQQQ